MRTAGGRRRLLVVLGVCLALGALTNALVTAWCVYGVSTRMRDACGGRWRDGGHEYAVNLMSAPGKAMVYWNVATEPSRVAFDFPVSTDSPFEPNPSVRPPRWATAGDGRIVERLEAFPPTQTAPDYVDVSRRCDVAYGWPLLSFRGGFNMLAFKGVEYDFGVELPMIETREPGPVIAIMGEPRVLPLTPIVPGLAVNTALYGVPWWLLLFAPGVVRRALRRRRGACAACGYDRRGIAAGAVCPECGRADAGSLRPSVPPAQ